MNATTPTIPGLPAPDEVPAIFARRALIPEQQTWISECRDERRACVLSAVAIDRDADDGITAARLAATSDDEAEAVAEIRHVIGVDTPYARGVMRGWDEGNAFGPTATDGAIRRHAGAGGRKFRDGYLWGVRAWQAVRAARGSQPC